ncbi:MAG: HAD family hydrolase [Candidatus Heimdallarchaeota archaeon]|nr:HAD family hydrolase [Candidatus Heimdallarchaeota archaeon]
MDERLDEITEEELDEFEEEIIEEDIEAIDEEIIKDEIEEETIVKEKESNPWIFFDYSGTLVDTVNALSKSYTRLLGKEFPPHQVKSLYKDYPKSNKFSIMLKYKISPFKYLFGGKKKFDEIRKEEFWNSVRAFPGIPEVLSRLSMMSKVKIAIVTHETELQDTEERERILQHFGIPNIFETVICDYWNKEESLNLFLSENDVSFGIFIGDTQFDLDIGKKNEFSSIGVTWGFSTRDELSADYVIDDPRELLQVLMTLIHKAEQQKLHGDPI